MRNEDLGMRNVQTTKEGRTEILPSNIFYKDLCKLLCESCLYHFVWNHLLLEYVSTGLRRLYHANNL